MKTEGKVGTSEFFKSRAASGYVFVGLRGFCMGSADVVPGVSGGTIAFILGIYEELIASIRSFDPAFVRLVLGGKIKEAARHVNLVFLVSLALGIFTAIFTLAKGLSWLLDNRPVLIWSFFFGLVAASVFTVSRRVKLWTPGAWVCLVLGTVGSYLLVGVVPAHTPDAWWFLILSGALAICAMILPGISGAYILVLLGKYKMVLDAVHQFHFGTLFLVAIGAVCGLLAFSHLLNWLFARYHDLAVAVLIGFMAGSLRKVWPWKEAVPGYSDITANALPAAMNHEVLVAALLCLLGVVVVLLLELADRRRA
ncbi:MAG: DUF368 domain-containing protein [Thermodesulfobacteriota bacterium]